MKLAEFYSLKRFIKAVYFIQVMVWKLVLFGLV